MDVFDILAGLVAAVLGAALAWLAAKAAQWLRTETAAIENDTMLQLVQSFVQAAEQLLGATDPTGELRKGYVMEHLERAGIPVTETVASVLEGEVWALNNADRMEREVHMDGNIEQNSKQGGSATPTPAPWREKGPIGPTLPRERPDVVIPPQPKPRVDIR